MDKEKQLFSQIQEIVGGYNTKEVDLADGLKHNLYQTLRTIEFYSNSRYLNGQKDTLGREKPFNNINTFRVNVAYRATDLDLKDIQIVADDITDRGNLLKATILSKEAYKWGKENGLSEFLNDFAYTRPKYGSVIVKKVVEIEEDGSEELELEVCAWQNMVIDPTNFEDGIIVERHFLKRHELAEKKDVWDNVEELLNKTKKQKEDIEVLEVHGYFPESSDPDASGNDDTVFNRKMFMIGVVNGKPAFILHSEDEDELPYRKLDWRKQDKRSLGVGVTEDGFEAQVWTNDSMIAEKNAMDLAGKVVIKTNSKKLGNNILEVDNGNVFYLEDGKDATVMNLLPSALPKYSELIQRWDSQYERVSSTFNAITGEQMPSGTPYRQTAILNQEAGSLFDQRREEAGIFISEIYMDWILPFLIKKLNKEHILTSEWSMEELEMIDDAFSTHKVNQTVIDMIINGEEVDNDIYNELVEAEKAVAQKQKNIRSIPVPKDYFKDFKCSVSVIITNEMRNKGAILESLSNILAQVGTNPAVLQDPVLSKVFSAIIEVSGVPISPVSLLSAQAKQISQAQMQQPVQQVQPAQPTVTQ